MASVRKAKLFVSLKLKNSVKKPFNLYYLGAKGLSLAPIYIIVIVSKKTINTMIPIRRMTPLSSSLRLKNVEYVQQLDNLPKRASTPEQLIDLIQRKLKPAKYAMIIHNKDKNDSGKLIEPHIHLALNFTNARSLNSISKIIGDKTQYFEKAKSWNNLCSYLCHRTTSAKQKYQYDPNEVVANFNYLELLEKITKQVENSDDRKEAEVINSLLNQMLNEDITREEAYAQLNGEMFAKAKRRVEDVHNRVLENKANRWRTERKKTNEPIRVYWIYGQAGVGKTLLAQKYANQLTDEFFITGSSKDPFQAYNGESVIILDELRPNSFFYSDLLKMLDNYNYNAASPSRYSDKFLVSDHIFITSPYSPITFYSQYKFIASEIDSFTQLDRRLNKVIFIDTNYYEEQIFNPDSNRYVQKSNTRRENNLLKDKNKFEEDKISLEFNNLNNFSKIIEDERND